MEIILYSTDCPKCKLLKMKLDERGINYEENKDIDAMLRLDIEQVPVLSVEGQLMDFNKAIAWISSKGE